MRVYISVDMEGVAGVVHESQTDPTNPACAAEYARFRRLMTAEANAAIEGALAAGATKLVVNDSHWFMRNLLAEELHQAAELLSGDPKPQSMVEGIDGGFDAAVFIGYHARAGTRHAILDHTYADRIHDVRLNGRPVGELGINAAFAGVAGVPVALVSGDSARAGGRLSDDPGRGHRGAPTESHALRARAPDLRGGGLRPDDPRGHGGAVPGGDADRRPHRGVHAPGLPRGVPRVARDAEPVRGGLRAR